MSLLPEISYGKHVNKNLCFETFSNGEEIETSRLTDNSQCDSSGCAPARKNIWLPNCSVSTLGVPLAWLRQVLGMLRKTELLRSLARTSENHFSEVPRVNFSEVSGLLFLLSKNF
jgi:hypothetical protein